MYYNEKLPLKVRTNTNYFQPDITRVVNTFNSPKTYQFRQQKIEGYETRLYWQYRYCDEHNGQTFFYTLTYNDRHVPSYYGKNCFDYEDLRDLLTGGFRKQLLRKYGTTFKYFVGAELGDGKGERGLLNNPHYHILFFLEDANNDKYEYKKISPEDFRHLVKKYWQGHDEIRDGFKDYRKFKYGIAKEGENIGLVTDFRACMYCAKYVCKDVQLIQHEKKIYKYLSKDVYDKYDGSLESYKDFFSDYVINEYDFVDLEILAPWDDGYEDCNYPIENGLKVLRVKVSNLKPETVSDYEFYLKKLDACSEYRFFLSQWIVPKIHGYIKEYRNRYCNKCRISHGVGDYALKYIDNDLEPSIPIPTKKGYKYRPISLYYYRKKYTYVDVVENESGIKSNRYIINDLGVDYKMHNLHKRLEKIKDKALSNIKLVQNDKDLYNRMLKSDVNTQVFTPYSEFFENYNYLLDENNINETVKRYAEYKYIYENRYFEDRRSFVGDDNYFCNINPFMDYYRFTKTVVFDRNAFRLSSFFEDGCKGYISYASHPYFLQYIGIFNLLDLCTDYFFIQLDNKRQKDAEEIANTKRFHNKLKLKEFYAFFEN